MFAVITRQQKNCSLLKKIKHFIRAPVLVPIQTKLYNSYYYLIELEYKYNINQLENLCNEFSDRLIISSEIVLPDNFICKKADSFDFDLRILINTAKYILKNSSIPLYSQGIGVIDSDALCQKIVRELIICCPLIKIFTLNSENYYDFCTEMMEEHGAVITIVNTPQLLSDMNIIISPRPFSWNNELLLKPPILSIQNIPLLGTVQLIHSLKPLLSDEFSAPVPFGISPYEFAAAAYKFCNLSFLENCVAQSGICKQNKPSVNQIANYINDEFYRQIRQK